MKNVKHIAIIGALALAGIGSATGLAELSLRDNDNDGLAELEMASGEWVEFDGTGFTVVP